MSLCGVMMVWMCVSKSRHGMPSILRAASSATISASVDECDTAPCFLQSHVIGTYELGPINTRNAPVVDLLSEMSVAKLASTNSNNRNLSGGSPMKHFCV